MTDNTSPNKLPGVEEVAASFRAAGESRADANWRRLKNLSPRLEVVLRPQAGTEYNSNSSLNLRNNEAAAEPNRQNSPSSENDESLTRSNEAPTFKPYNTGHSEATSTPSKPIAPRQSPLAHLVVKSTPLSEDRVQDLHEALTAKLPGLPPSCTSLSSASNAFTGISPQIQAENDSTKEVNLRGGGTSGDSEDDFDKTNKRQDKASRGKKNHRLEGDDAILSTDRTVWEPLANAMITHLWQHQDEVSCVQRAAERSALAGSSGDVAAEDRDAIREDRGEEEDGGNLDERNEQEEGGDEENRDGGRGEERGDSADRGDGEGGESREDGRDQDEGGSGRGQGSEEGKDSEDGQEYGTKDIEDDGKSDDEQEEMEETSEDTDDGGVPIDSTPSRGESAEDQSAQNESTAEHSGREQTASAQSQSIAQDPASSESISDSEQINTPSTGSAPSSEPAGSENADAPTASPDNEPTQSSTGDIQGSPRTGASANVQSQSDETQDFAPVEAEGEQQSTSANTSAATTTGNTQALQQANVTTNLQSQPIQAQGGQSNAATFTASVNTHSHPQASTSTHAVAPTLLSANHVYHTAPFSSSTSSWSSSTTLVGETEEPRWVPNPTNFGINKRRCPMCIQRNAKQTCSGGPPCDACARLGYNARQCQTGEKGEEGGGKHEGSSRKRGKRGGGMDGTDFVGKIVA
ncbi:hypothetical protein V8E51_018034 [Hyaloscypha variabilis]